MDKKTKILILNGSPHKEKSTTMFAAAAFAGGIAEETGGEMEVINIADLNVRPCLGCLSCWGRTEGQCVIQDDDIPEVKRKILESDIIIESFPLYFFGMPGIVKVFTDRMLSMIKTYEGQGVPRSGESAHGLRYPDPDKSFVLISSCAYTETNMIYDPLKTQFDLICGAGEYTSLFFPQLKTLVDKGGSRKTRFETRIMEAGREFGRERTLSPESAARITKAPFPQDVYKVIIENVWDEQRRRGSIVNADEAGNPS